jgi:hypothetical protein
LSENALKLTYGKVEFQSFSGEDPRIPAPNGGKGTEGRVEEGRGVGRGRDGEVGRKGWKGRAKGKGREGKWRKGREGERNLDNPPAMFQTGRRHRISSANRAETLKNAPRLVSSRDSNVEDYITDNCCIFNKFKISKYYPFQQVYS